ESAVPTRHVALVPDGARAAPGLLRRMRELLEGAEGGGVKVVAAGVGTRRPRCLELDFDVKTWTARYGHSEGRSDQHGVQCGALDGAPAVLLLRTDHLFSLPFPLSRPVVTSLSFQASLRGWRFLLLPSSFPSSPPLPLHAQDQQLHRALMEELGVKLEILPGGLLRRWHGCTKSSARCFPTIQAQTPQYLLGGRWTPPCCLQALRLTARHVLARLEAAGVRHWLEGGSLLGAVRSGDLIPWDYDVDVGFYLEDLPKCSWLAAVRARGQPVEDPQGFLWEKAAEGEFFRVHFSRSNRLHVDLWPFYPREGGVMTKDTWLPHGQDVEFPESFLVPLGSVGFVGLRAKAPNDPRAFLELKFGPGAVERPEY
ncbi:FKRP protein, partial [Rhadina sibilatrix]|nr:FKRP protein [Rhadina sibilatrix]